MDAYSTYQIRSDQEDEIVLAFSDRNPEGVKMTILNEKTGEGCSLLLPRMEMIEALEYVLMKIKAKPEP